MKKKILHVLTELPEKYNSKFVDFSNEKLTDFEHYFYPIDCNFSKFEFGELSPNILAIDVQGSSKRFIQLRDYLASQNYDLIVFHGFFFGGWQLVLLTAWLFVHDFGDRCFWMTWGGDTYYFQNGVGSLRGRISNWLRRHALKKVPFFGAAVPQEEDLIRFHYAPNAFFVNVFYPTPLTSNSNRKNISAQRRRYRVLAGNSADPSNNHDAMYSLLKAVPMDFDIYSPLAYGGALNARRVSALGSKIFEDRFVGQMSMVSPQEYAEILNSIDFGVFYHNRQQGLGNILFLLSQGKPVFLRPDTLSFEFLKERGWAVESIYKLPCMSENELFLLIQKASDIEAMNDVTSYFSDQKAADLWLEALWKIMARVRKSRLS